MSIENSNVIDFCSIDKQGNVVLTISDHLSWDDTKQHLLFLQSKINAYLHTIESGELLENYPAARDKNVVINLVMQYWPSPAGHQYLEKAKAFLNERGYDFYYKKLVADN
jgi:hypothetical protein